MERDPLLTLAADLIRAPSPSGAEGPAVEVMLSAFRDLGFDAAHRDEAGNAVGVIRRGDGPIVMLNGHLDTVPVGDATLWPYPPLDGVVAEGRLWGRGASDMKSSLACMAHAAADAAANGFRGTLIVAGVVQEEVGGLGARHMGRTLPVDVVVLGEPSRSTLKLGHRGRTEVEVDFPGAIAHAAKASLGENALYHAARYLAALERLELPTGGPLGGSSATPTQLVTFPEGGANVVPGAARLTIDYRTIPGDDEAALHARLAGIAHDPRIELSIPIEDAVSEDGGLRQSYARATDPYLVDAAGFAATTARDTLKRVLPRHGLTFEEGTWWFCTDAPHLAVSGAEVVGYGPGDEELAHTTRECVDVERLGVARDVYKELALAYLGRP